MSCKTLFNDFLNHIEIRKKEIINSFPPCVSLFNLSEDDKDKIAKKALYNRYLEIINKDTDVAVFKAIKEGLNGDPLMSMVIDPKDRDIDPYCTRCDLGGE